MTLAYAEALELVHARTNAIVRDAVSKRAVRFAIEEMLRLAAETAERDGTFRIPMLGVLYRATRKARSVRNPITGEPMQLSAGTAVKLRCAKHLRGVVAR